MASGIDGPGNYDSNPSSPNNNVLDDKAVADNIALTDSPSSTGKEESAESGSGNVMKSPVPPSPPVSENRLSFSGLMAFQSTNQLEPANNLMTSVHSDHPLDRPNTANHSSSYNPSLHMDTSLNDEIEKVFEDEPFELKMDFSNPSAPVVSQEPSASKYDEGDFLAHRKSQVHMYQPMATRLPSNEVKNLQKAHGGDGPKRRRHRSSSSSGSSKSKGANPTAHIDKKQRKKGKKHKKSKRKPLSATMRGRTLSIPEEEEEEEEEESEEEEEESDRNEDKDEEGQGEGDRRSEREEEDGEEDLDDDEGEQGGEEGGKKGNLNVDGSQATLHPDNNAVVFTVGSTPVHTANDKAYPNSPLLTVSPADGNQMGSFSSVKSGETGPGSSSSSDNERADSPSIKKAKKKSRKSGKHSHHRHHKRRHKHDITLQRKMSGLQVKNLGDNYNMDGDINEVTEAEMKSHRFEDLGGIRKHLLHRPVKKRKMRTEMKKKHDRKPHEVFVELDELVAGEWKETARWIKFEEDVEESEMWGKPRVASLSFHSLLELRKTIEKGAVMLDVDKKNLTEVSNAVVEEMVRTGQIRAEDQGNILKVLLSKHKHIVTESGFRYNLSQASISSFFTNPSYAARMNSVGMSSNNLEHSKPLIPSPTHDVEKGQTEEHTDAPSVNRTLSTRELKIMRKIPIGAEATAVLVGTVDYLEQPTMAFVRLAEGTDLENVVALPIPVRFIFVLLGPAKQDYDYHEIGRSISTLMADQEFHVMAYGAENRKDLLRAINEFLDDSIVLPPGQLENPDLLRNISKYQSILKKKEEKKIEKAPPPTEDDPLKRTGRCFGGLIDDVKRRYPKYLSDITDAFNFQCLASIIFIYFAALSPAITFGGLLGEKTDNLMGVSEMILGCCIAGCTYGLISGQPMLIVGSTGPLLVFEEAVFTFCGDQLPFLAVRVWVGLWIFVICIVVVAFEGSFLVRFVSRFTQEIFTALIALIFIFETFKKLAKTYAEHPLTATYPPTYAVLNQYNCSVNISLPGNQTQVPEEILNQPNTALLSTLLMFGTFIIAYFLRQFKNSKFLRSSVRRTIGDFGVPIAIFAMLLLDIAIKDTYTQKLNVPKGISPTDPSKRGWFINPLGEPDFPLPWYMIFAAAIPAFLVFILIFMESHITEMIVSGKERNLKKGTGYHLDLLVMGLLNAVLSLLGMPWVCAAAIRSITHVNSLTIMSTTQAPGEKPKIIGVHEQRVTVFFVNAFLGLSILMQPLLKEIPLAVLFGIFLYMGVTSLAGVEFIDRLELLFMPSKNYPDFSYVKAIKPFRIHIFTIIEFVCLAVLWAVKSTPAQIAFPFFLVLTVPFRRYVLPKIFTQRELSELDSDG